MNASAPSAGKLTERVTIARRIEMNPDAPHDYGNVVAEWADEGTVAAEYIHLRGGEAVLAGRLQGKHPQIVRVRASSLTRQVSTDWRVTDARTGTVFNVKDVTHTPDRAWVEWLCESGSAA